MGASYSTIVFPFKIFVEGQFECTSGFLFVLKFKFSFEICLYSLNDIEQDGFSLSQKKLRRLPFVVCYWRNIDFDVQKKEKAFFLIFCTNM